MPINIHGKQSLAAEQLLTTESQKAVVSLFILLSGRCKGACYNKDKYKQIFNIEQQSGTWSARAKLLFS